MVKKRCPARAWRAHAPPQPCLQTEDKKSGKTHDKLWLCKANTSLDLIRHVCRGFFQHTGGSDAYAREMDLEAEEYVLLPKGMCCNRRKSVWFSTKEEL